MKEKRVLAGLAAAMMALSLTACGSGADDTADSAVSGAASASASAQTDGKEVKKALVSNMMNPLSWVDGDGNLQGYEYDVTCKINELLENYTLEIEAVSEEVQDITMEAGEADYSVGGYGWTQAREDSYEVPETPIGASAFMLYVRGEDKDKITCMEDVVENGYSIVPVAPNGGIYKALVEWNEANGSPLESIPTQDGLTTAEKLQALADGQYDVFINTNNCNNLETAEEMGLDVVEVSEPIQVNKTIVLIKKGETDFCNEVNAALQQLQEDGTLKELSEKWYGYDLADLLEE